jgi:glucokinase
MFISIDLGGTSTRVASSYNLKDLSRIEKFATNRDIFKERALIKNAIDIVAAGLPIECICVGAPGIVDAMTKQYIKLPNYSILDGEPFGYLLDDVYRDTPLVVSNDAALAGLAEAVYGEGKSYNIIAYITLSTGVGGVRIQDQSIDAFRSFWEPGHQIIVENGRLHERCGQRGCLEAYASGTAFEEIYKMKPEDCSDPKIWEEYATHLATGLLNVIAMWNPGVIIFGGNISNKFDSFLPPLKAEFDKQTFFAIPDLKLSTFRDNAGLLGGFTYIQKLKQNNLLK